MEIYILKYGYDYEGGGEIVGVFLSKDESIKFYENMEGVKYGDFYEVECWNIEKNDLIWSIELDN